MDYSEITAPLFKILSKENTVFHLEPSCQMAFEDLKSRLVTDPSCELQFLLLQSLQLVATRKRVGKFLHIERRREELFYYRD